MKINWSDFLSQHDLVYERSGKAWPDGIPLGNGALGAIAYAPAWPEFVINKTDVGDYRRSPRRQLTHRELLAFMRKGGTAEELDRLEGGAEPYPTPKSCAILRLTLGADAGWAALPRIQQRLSLHDARLFINLDKHLSHPRVETFVCRDRNVLVARVRDVSWAEAFNNRVELFRPSDAEMPAARLKVDGEVGLLEQRLPDGSRYTVAIKMVPTGGNAWKRWVQTHFRKQYWPKATRTAIPAVNHGRLTTAIGGDFDLFLAVVTNRESRDPSAKARRMVEAAARAGYTRLFQSHRAWWHAFWRKSLVKLDQPLMEELWYVSQYHLASCYGQAPVSALCGLWYGFDDQPVQILPWKGVYTNDQNSEMPAMPLFSSNHPELAESFYETFNRMLPSARRMTRKIYELDGVCFPGGSDINGFCPPCGHYGRIHCGGPFHGLIYVWGYRFTRDRRILKEYVYPFLREICIFFTEYMQLDPRTGRYRLWPSVPAEVMVLDSANPTQTIALLKVCLRQAVEGAEILNVDHAWVRRWRDLLERFPEYPVDHGIVLEAEGVPWNHYTSQYGGLYPVYPCGEWDADSPAEIRRRVRRTFESYETRFTMRSYADRRGNHHFNGWGWFFANGMALRMGWVKEAWEMFWSEPLRCHLKPNGLFTHNAFAIMDPSVSEANLAKIPRIKIRDGKEWMPLSEPMHSNSGSECSPNPEAKERVFPVLEMTGAYLTFVNETLLQSHGGRIRVFPAAPPKFTGGFEHLRAEGAFLVSSWMAKGMVTHVRVRSLAGGELCLVNPWGRGQTHCIQNGHHQMVDRQEKIRIPTRPGTVCIFYQDRRAWQAAERKTLGAERTAGPQSLAMQDGSVAWLGKRVMPSDAT